jgi:hypothetical protein
VAGCSDSQNPGGASLTTTILLADAPFPHSLVSSVELFVLDVRLGTAAGVPCSEAAIVVAPYRAFELLELQRGVTASLGEAQLSTGEYRTVCLTIEPERSFIELRGRGAARIDWGAPGTRVLQAELLTPIIVGDAGTSIVVHIDLGASFQPLPRGGPFDIDQGFVFLPVLGAVDPARTGGLTGRVVVEPTGSPIADASVRLSIGEPGSAPESWRVMATGVTDADGTFHLPFLAPSERWAAQGRQYVLDMDPPPGRPFVPGRREDVAILAGRETSLADMALAPEFDLRENRIAFLVDETNVFSMREDGSNRTALTNYPSGEYERTEIAAWSPDGTELLGMREEITPLDEKIVVVAGDGSGARFIAQGFGASGIFPGVWSPDGSRLAYVKAHGSHGTELRIHTIARDGSGDAVLNTGSEPLELASDYAPAWSPDGREIAFIGYRPRPDDFPRSAFIVPANGASTPRQLLPEDAFGVAWAPDGGRLALLTGSSDFRFGDIVLVNRDGTGRILLSAQERTDAIPVWSPDGSRLAFTSIRDGNEEIYVMNADGGDVQRLTDHAGLDRAPVWSPDGTRLAFQSDRDGNWEIYTVATGGTGLTNLTRSQEQETDPQWR